MNPLELTDEDARNLIEILKVFLKKYRVDVSPGNRGDLLLAAEDQSTEFILTYNTPKHRDDKITIHLREKETNLNLIRINIDPTGFHNNSDGKVYGNRILVFSSEEWYAKDDGFTHVKAYPLPNEFKEINNIEQVFLDFLVYINIKQEGKITFPHLV